MSDHTGAGTGTESDVEGRRLSVPSAALLTSAVALVAALALLGLGGTAAGSDAISIFEYEPDTVEVEPGETVTVEVDLFAGSTAHDVGVDRVNTTLRHDAEALTVTAVEAGPWLAGTDGAVQMTADVDDENGTVRVAQHREPSGDGVTGGGTLLAVTIDVAADAEAGNYTLSYGDSEVQMVNDHYQPVFTHNGSLVVTDGAGAGTAADDGEPGRFALGIATIAALGVLGAVVVYRLRRGRE